MCWIPHPPEQNYLRWKKTFLSGARHFLQLTISFNLTPPLSCHIHSLCAQPKQFLWNTLDMYAWFDITNTWCCSIYDVSLYYILRSSKANWPFFLEIMTLCVPGSIYAVLHIVQFPTPANTLGTNYYIRSGSEMSNLLVFHRFLVCSVEFCTNSKCQMDSIWEIGEFDCFFFL